MSDLLKKVKNILGKEYDWIPVKMSRVKNGEALRTDVIEGVTINGLLEKGKSFFVYGESLAHNGAMRSVNTSPIVEIKEVNDYKLITTASGSIYKIEIIEGSN